MALKPTKELFTENAEKIANDLVKNGGDSNISTTQIRKFYNDFQVLKAKADTKRDENEFKEDILPLIYLSKAKLAYAYGKDNGKISKEFVDSLNKYIDMIETKDDFETFMNFYQALIGYTTYLFKEKDEKNKANQKERDKGKERRQDYNDNSQYYKGGKR